MSTKSDKETLAQDMKEASKEYEKESNTNMKKDIEKKDEHLAEKKKKKESHLPVSESPKSITFHSSGGSFASDEIPPVVVAAAASAVTMANRFGVEVVEPDLHHKVEDGMVGGGTSSYLMSKKEAKLNKALLWLRILALFFCLVSFSVMADNRKKGTPAISFYNFSQFKYVLSMNVIGFVYSAVQILKYLITQKHMGRIPYLDFVMDQALTYLLLSASTSAATVARLMWGSTRDVDGFIEMGYGNFMEMANASIALSFLAFKAFALATIISGYMLLRFKH